MHDSQCQQEREWAIAAVAESCSKLWTTTYTYGDYSYNCRKMWGNCVWQQSRGTCQSFLQGSMKLLLLLQLFMQSWHLHDAHPFQAFCQSIATGMRGWVCDICNLCEANNIAKLWKTFHWVSSETAGGGELWTDFIFQLRAQQQLLKRHTTSCIIKHILLNWRRRAWGSCSSWLLQASIVTWNSTRSARKNALLRPHHPAFGLG